MARVRSPEKRQALLRSAGREIAEASLGVSTAKIAKGAGLAEGTMFRFFVSKNDLLNEPYIELKTETYRLILRPRTFAPSLKMTPAPRKPTPETT